jgi:phosphatidylserine/phosphatidylglycerophosphate/cardiolipin synthase-like enzyme
LATGLDMAAGILATTTVREFEETLRKNGHPKWEVERLLMSYMATEAVVIVKEGIEFEASEIRIDPSKIQARGTPPGEAVVEDGQSVLKLVCTTPTRLAATSMGFGVLQTEDVFRRLIRQAKRELVIVSPFLEREGVYALRSELFAASKQKVMVKLLTRRIENSSITLAVSDLFGIFGECLAVKEFHTELRVYERWRQLESTHAKLLLRDQEEMYVGSAEIRPNALYSNFEIGVIVNDKEVVKDAHSLFSLFWEDSGFVRPVTAAEIRRKVEKMVR